MRREDGPRPSLRTGARSQPRRLVELVVDFVLMCGSFLAAYCSSSTGRATTSSARRSSPRCRSCSARVLCFVLGGIYRRVWRYATTTDELRDRRRRAPCRRASPGRSSCSIRGSTGLPAVGLRPRRDLRAVLVGGSRLGFRVCRRGGTAARSEPTTARVLVVGAGRLGRGSPASCARRRAAGRRLPRRQPRPPRAPHRRPARARPARRDRARCSRRRTPPRSSSRSPTPRTSGSRSLSAACADAGVPCTPHAPPARSRLARRPRLAASDASERVDRRRRLRPESACLLLYAVTAGLALWQASNHPTPTIFTDELEMTQLARAIAETGHATLRGQPIHGLAPLVAYLSAPFWWLNTFRPPTS